MLIRVTSNLLRDSVEFKPGAEIYLPNKDAVMLIDEQMAEPASRLARRLYKELGGKRSIAQPANGGEVIVMHLAPYAEEVMLTPRDLGRLAPAIDETPKG